VCLQAAGQLQEEAEELEGKVQERMTEELRQKAEWKCDECASYFVSSDGLYEHVKMPGRCDRKKGRETGLTCPRCSAEFSKHGNWQKHVDYSPDCQSKKIQKDMKKANKDTTNGEEATNKLKEATYEVEEAANEVEEAATEVEETAAEVEEAAAEVEETAAEVEEAAAEVEEAAAEVEETAAEVEEAADVTGSPAAASVAAPTSTIRHFSHVRFTFN
jgi:uncharacterized C2H2 Zn-finger protein